jgi:cbb3-type cytochrome oxidase maturation protein
MSVVLVILPLALLVVGSAVAAFVWAARSGQFDDTDTPPSRMLADDAGEPDAQAASSRAGGASGSRNFPARTPSSRLTR